MNDKQWNVTHLIHKILESEWIRKATYFIPQNVLHLKTTSQNIPNS